jgi:hypothetical protein
MLGKCIGTCIFFPGRFFKFHQTKQQRQMPPRSRQRNTAPETLPAPEDPVQGARTCAAGRNARAATSDIPPPPTAARTLSSGDQSRGFAGLSGTIFHSWFFVFCSREKKGIWATDRGDHQRVSPIQQLLTQVCVPATFLTQLMLAQVPAPGARSIPQPVCY